MVHINGVLLILSSVILAGISAPAVHERQIDCALSSSESHPAVERVLLEERQRVQEEDVALEERQHVQEDASVTVVNVQMEAEYAEKVSHLQVKQSEKAVAQEAEDISAVAKTGAAAVDKIQSYIQMIARDAVVLDRSVAAVTKRLTVPQGLAMQRQFAALTMTMAQGTRVIRAARPLTSFESRQLLSAIRVYENEFMDLIATIIEKKTTFARLPYNIMPYIATAVRNLGSMTDGFGAALEGVVTPNARQTVHITRKTLARAFQKAYNVYA